MYTQNITPNPNIPCTPGWCLDYVRRTFGLPAHYGTAMEAWNASGPKHVGSLQFPANDVPVFFALAGVPAGHVALRMRDGSVYSSSDLGNTPHHHPSLTDLEAYYAHYGKPLTYLGWTEDCAGTRVITPIVPKPPAPRPVTAQSAPARPANGVRLIRVETGDNLTTIAAQFGTTVAHLVAMNGIRDANAIFPGQILRY